MADPKNPGYQLQIFPTNDPDVFNIGESDDVEGEAPLRAVSAVEAARLHHAARTTVTEKPAAKKVAPSNKPAGGATTAKKKAVKRG